MKFAKTVMKNFKVLFRLKTSLITVILGPLLVIFLIGFAFSSTSNMQVNLGIVQADESDLTTNIIDSLKTDEYTIKKFQTKNECVTDLKQGVLHACIIFPKDFVIANDKTNNITFIVDKSRVNVVYAVIEKISTQIGITEDELSQSLTQTLTDTLQDTSSSIDQTIGSLIKIKKNVNDASHATESSQKAIQKIDTEMVDIKVDYSSEFNTLHTYTKKILEDVDDTVVEGLVLAQNIAVYNTSLSNSLENILETLNESAVDRENASNEKLIELEQGVITAQDELDKLETKLDDASKAKQDINTGLDTLKNKLSSITNEITQVQSNLESTAQKISRIEVTSSEQIANPITTTIETVSSDKNQLVILFPYVNILIIMFVGLMLASTLVMVEKKSRASFRVFTTPTRDDFFIGTTFVTAFIIILAQVGLILGVVSYFVSALIITNIAVNIAILILSISLFIFIGMAIGYMMSNQQGTNMASISIGAIFLFLSNIILPIESIAPYLQSIARYNPFVVASESLRRSLLFSSSFAELFNEFIILIVYSIALYVIIILTQKVSKMKYFNKNPHIKRKHHEQTIKGLVIGETVIRSEHEFIRLVKSLDEKDFKSFVKKNNRSLKHFLIHILKKKELAKNIKKVSKNDVLKAFAVDSARELEDIDKKQEHRKRKSSANSKDK